MSGIFLHRRGEASGFARACHLLFTDSVIENIRDNKPDATRVDVITAAMAAGAHQSILALADGYEKPFSANVSSSALQCAGRKDPSAR